MQSRLEADKKASPLLEKVEDLRRDLRLRDPESLARLTGARYLPTGPGQGEFHLSLWDREVVLTYPEGLTHTAEGQQPLRPPDIALVLYYFHTADGTPLSHRWISFADLPDGRFYNQAFQGYTGRELARRFGGEIEEFERRALLAGGERHDFGDIAFKFPVLPHLAFLVVLWQGDEDFPASCQILFDASAPHNLPTDACAVAGSLLTHRLLGDS